jgi:hypothetical protein
MGNGEATNQLPLPPLSLRTLERIEQKDFGVRDRLGNALNKLASRRLHLRPKLGGSTSKKFRRSVVSGKSICRNLQDIATRE